MTNTQQETLHTGDKLAAMKAQKMWIFAALSAFAGSALAQWQWVGDDGRKVFSDLPPPAHIAPQKILKRPAALVVKPAAEAPEPAAQAKTHAAEPAGQQEQEAAHKEEAVKQAEEAAKLKAQAAKEKQEAAKLAQQRQINCQQAQAAQATLQSGRMLSHINERGEQGFISDEQRKQQLQRAQTVIKNECGAAGRK